MQKKTKQKLKPLVFASVIGEPAALELAALGDDAAEALFTPVEPESAAAPALVMETVAEINSNNASIKFLDSPTLAATAAEEAAQPELQSPPAEKAASAPKTRATPRPAKRSSDLPGWARSAYWIAIPAAVLWAGAMAAFASGYQNPFGPFEYRPFPMVAFAGLCLLPAVFILLAAYAVRQAAKLSVETRRARDLANDIAIPAALAADQVGGAAEAVRREIDRAAAAASAAEQQLLNLRRSLSEESERLVEATNDAERRAHDLTQSLAREREEMSALSKTIDAQTQAVSDAIGAGSRMMVEASDLAATQIQEAEAALAARATDLAAAAGEAGEAAQIVGQALSEQVGRLEVASETITERIGGVQGALSGEHERLIALADSLRADQQHIAAQIEAQRTQLLTASADARASAEDLTEASTNGAESLRALIATVAEQVGQLAITAEADQIAIGAQAQANFKLFSGVVAEERASMDAQTRAAIEAMATAAAETRRAAVEQTEAARERVEQLGEAAFAAGQKADRAFDARIGVARQMIEQSAGLLEEAGQRSAERIEAGLAATHGALEDLEKLLGTIDAKVAALPDDARARAETVRQAVEQGIDELTAAARKAAEETQAIDAAFQGRIKQNYEVLSEALRLMGRVAGAADATAKGAPLQLGAPPKLSTRPPEPEPAVRAALAPTDRAIRVPPETFANGAASVREGGADAIGLRPRLKLTVDAPAPMEPRRAAPPPVPVQARSSTAAADADEWTWKDLLSSIDEPMMDDEVLAERLIAEIEALGLDAPALLPLTKIDEIAAVMQAGDLDGVRDVVRNLAPSAVRRLSRRVLTDKVLRAHADRYLQRYEDLLTDSAKRDRDGFVTATLLGSDPGRAFLLFNAAVGELH